MSDGAELLHPWSHGWYGELAFEASWAPRLPPHEQPSADDASSGGPSGQQAPKVLQLSLAEAFYLAFVLPEPRLRVEQSGCSPIGAQEAWRAFSGALPRFVYHLAAYRALRRAGWLVRCGLKYGADYALYAAEGGKHAVFCALVQAPALGDEPPSWIAMQQHTRVCGQVSKGLLLCAVGVEGGVLSAEELQSAACLERLEVQMLTLSPWWAAKEHGTLSL